MKKFIYLGALALMATSFFACKKNSDDSTSVSIPQFHAGQSISHDTLNGSVKGTMLAGKTYYFGSPVTVNAGDTLVMQSGVKLLSFDPSAQLIINGSFISLGSESAPNWITGTKPYANPSAYKLTTLQDPNTDPGLMPTGKFWGGIQCGKTCGLVDIKWTHLDFAGGTSTVLDQTQLGYSVGGLLFTIFFQNPNGYLILEDSWIYGSSSDATRIQGGNIHIMRNTVEKLAYNDGDAFNVKNATTGDMAFNLIIGSAKGGTKASNKGVYGPLETKINMYNNTYISGGWRSVDPDRGANVNYEQQASGSAYNNIMVNCKTGLRILDNPAADTTNCHYGYNLSYGDSLQVVAALYPHISHPSVHDIPNPTTFLSGFSTNQWKLGSSYDATILVGQNNPKFKNFPLPVSGSLSLYNFQGNFDFHLTSGSPAIGKGFTGFAPLNATSAISNSYLKATVTNPSIDLGAFPIDGSGNKH